MPGRRLRLRDRGAGQSALASRACGSSAASASNGTTETFLRVLSLRPNWTTPSTTAKSVSSLARRTFSPAWNLVPRWRTRMFPASTRSPPYFFTPRRWALESRPLRVDPPPFLCAIAASPSAEGDVVHAHLGEPLPVALLAAVVLAALVLEDDDLLAAAVADHLGGNRSATQDRRAHLDGVAVGAQEHLAELDRLPRLGFERLDADGLAGLGAILVAADADDGVHVVPKL